MKYNLIRQNRKTIAISINEKGQIIVKAPIKTSLIKIEEFLYEKENWIIKHINRINQINSFKQNFDFENCVYIMGKECKLKEIDICFPKSNEKNFAKKINDLYLSFAKQNLPQLVEEYRGQLNYNSLKFCNSKRVWGSFDRNFNMKLNWRLIMLPKELIKYVIIHELCHGIELNHSASFWKQVRSYCPNYKSLKKQLELYSFLLYI